MLERASLKNSFPTIITQMAENNSQAANIIDNLIKNKGEKIALATLFLLNDMNIRGVQINTLYRMCHHNIEKMYEKIIGMTPEDINELNYRTANICKYKAVFNGSKEERKEKPEKYIFTENEIASIRKQKEKNIAHDLLSSILSYKNTKNTKKIVYDLKPNINTNEALEILKKNGFICGYQENYLNKENQKITYRVFHNINDIIITNSLNDKFLWGKSYLIATRKSQRKIGDSYNEGNITTYFIDLREKPFTLYQEIQKEELINQTESLIYSKYLPIIYSKESLEYKINNHTYQDEVIADITSLLDFPKTYEKLAPSLKKIYKPFLSHAEDMAYNNIIKYLKNNKDHSILKKIPNLDKTKLINIQKKII